MRPPVKLVDHDPAWPARFEAERARLVRVLALWLAGGDGPIEHVGSTAVPGMPAKPIIDIMAGARSLDAARGCIPSVEAAGYEHWPYRPDVMHWFCRPSDVFRTHHLHVVPVGSRTWRERLAFRDALRDEPETARAYLELKRDLSARFRDDREAYTEAKSAFIRRTVDRLRGSPPRSVGR